MPPSNSLKLEQRIIQIFSDCMTKSKTFRFEDRLYSVKCVGKPRPSHGECKTDVYIKGESYDGSLLELKLSVKDKTTNEFQGNKLKAEDANNYFGANWAKIIKKASLSISKNFEETHLIFAKGKHPTKANSMTLGWKLEIANKRRPLSAEIPLTIEEIRNFIFKGTTLSKDKKNAKVNGIEIQDSGVANYLVFANINDLTSTDDVISRMILIDSYQPPQIYLIYTANNYRTKEDKADGPRSLAVQIKWHCIEGRLHPEFIFNEPLVKTGEGDMKPILLTALEELGKRNPEDMDENDVSNGQFLYV